MQTNPKVGHDDQECKYE